MILAHRKETELGIIEQDLGEHLKQVALRASDISKKIELESYLALIGLCHDAGKSDRKWQRYIKGDIFNTVNHSSAGARFFKEILIRSVEEDDKNTLWFQYCLEVGQYIILAHHGIFDLIKNGRYVPEIRDEYDTEDGFDYQGSVCQFMDELTKDITYLKVNSLEQLCKIAAAEFKAIYRKIEGLTDLTLPNSKLSERTNCKSLYISFLTRLVLSILKEADIYDSANYGISTKDELWSSERLETTWKDLANRIESQYEVYNRDENASILNRTRTKLANQAKEFSVKYDHGIFILDLPTGAGKTNCVTRFCLNNADMFSKSRFIYVTSFISVLSQSVKAIREITKEDVILEHHSNVGIESEALGNESLEDQADYRDTKYLMESWEVPIITTTLVQFFNTLMKGKSSNIRRFSKLIDACIVIDETQNIPLKAVYLYNLMLNFLSKIMRCTIIQCTATPPAFDMKSLSYPLNTSLAPRICKPEDSYNQCFQRVKYYSLLESNANKELSVEELRDHLRAEMVGKNSCLIVVNTKKAALEIYNQIKESVSGVEVVYLSTNLCPAHRVLIIDDLKEQFLRIRSGTSDRRIICVSTQLIEAGVDLDFDVVYRSLAGIDSIIQAAGRCNREGKLNDQKGMPGGKVFIFSLLGENLNKLTTIKQQREASKEAFRKTGQSGKEVDIYQVYSYYCQKYFIENLNEMGYIYPNKQDKIVDSLGNNQRNRKEYKNLNAGKKYRMKLAQSFESAAKTFNLIEEDTIGVIVPFRNQELLEDLNIAIENESFETIKALLKLLQPYTINIYSNCIDNRCIRSELDGSILFLEEGCYSLETGATWDSMPDFIL